MSTANDSIIIEIPRASYTVPNFTLDTARIISEAEKVVSAPVVLQSTIIENADSWLTGREGSSRQGSIYGNSGILTIITILFVFVALNFKECRKLFLRFLEDLRSGKKRENVFDEHSSHETRLTILMIIQLIIYGGIVLCGATILFLDEPVNYIEEFVRLLRCIAIFGIYYIFQLCAYSVIGYTFAGDTGRQRLLRSFNATQSMAGAALMIPALLMLFYPGSIFDICMLAGGIYFIARIVFIAKGFSIFYNNIFSLVYFILYLCALEIIPLIYLFKLALLIRK